MRYNTVSIMEMDLQYQVSKFRYCQNDLAFKLDLKAYNFSIHLQRLTFSSWVAFSSKNAPIYLKVNASFI